MARNAPPPRSRLPRPWALPLALGAALLLAPPAPAKERGRRSPPPEPAPQRALPDGARVVLFHGDDEYQGDPRVGTYVSSSWGFSTNTFWIEGPEGLVLIDTQFLPSAAEEAVAWAEKATGKKVKLAVVLHANPDKFNGTASLQARGIPVVTSAQVRALIPEVHRRRLEAFYDRFRPDYPKEAARPDVFGDKTTELSAAGLQLTAHVLGPGCSDAHVVVEWEGHLFTGDLVASGSHSWLELGHVDEWLQRLDELEQLEPDFVHPGRGPSGDARLLTTERRYLRDFADAVGAERPAGKLDDAAAARIRGRLDERYPGYRFGVFLFSGVRGVWEQQAGRATPLAPEAAPAPQGRKP